MFLPCRCPRACEARHPVMLPYQVRDVASQVWSIGTSSPGSPGSGASWREAVGQTLEMYFVQKVRHPKRRQVMCNEKSAERQGHALVEVRGGGVAQSGDVGTCASQEPQRDAGATGTGAGPPRMREASAGPNRMIAKKSPLVTISAADVECGRPVAVAAPQECGLPRPDRPGPAVPAPGPVRR